ncbi:hypothetical protein [Massilia sp. SYSU DXS3249]
MKNKAFSIDLDPATHAASRMRKRSKRRLVKTMLMRRQRGWRLLVRLALSGAVATMAGVALVFGQAASA